MVKIGVDTALRKQLSVRPVFHYSAILHHKNLVSFLNGGKMMRDYDRRFPLHQALERLYYELLGRSV
jgi:hypothetical protein